MPRLRAPGTVRHRHGGGPGVRDRRHAPLNRRSARSPRNSFLLRKLLPPAAPDLSPAAVARWPADPSALRPRSTRRPPSTRLAPLFPHAGDVPRRHRRLEIFRSPVPRRARSRPGWGKRCAASERPVPGRSPADDRPRFRSVVEIFPPRLQPPAVVGDILARHAGWPFDPARPSPRGERAPPRRARAAERLKNVEGALPRPEGESLPERGSSSWTTCITSGATARAAPPSP